MKKSISDLSEHDVIRFPVAPHSSVLSSIKGQEYTVGYVNRIETDNYGSITEIEILEIVPLNPNPHIQEKLSVLQSEGVTYEDVPGNPFGLNSNHTASHSHVQNKWAIIGTPKYLRLDEFSQYGYYQCVGHLADEGYKKKIQTLKSRAKETRYMNAQRGYAQPRAENVWTGANLPKNADRIEGREWDNLPQDQLNKRAKARKPKGTQSARKFDLPLVFTANAMNIPEDFLALFTKPANKNLRPVKTLQQLYQISQQPDILGQYLPNPKPDLVTVLDWVAKDDEKTNKYLAISRFKHVADDMEPITEWEDLIGYIKDCKADPTPQGLEDYVEGVPHIPDFLLSIDKRLKCTATAFNVPTDNPTTAIHAIQAVRQKFMDDVVNNRLSAYTYQSDTDMTIDLIPADRKLGSVQAKTIETTGGRSVKIKKGDTSILRLGELHYRFM